jgi:DNA-binding transcriptional regulator YdaS (Cro superfamily)
LFCFVVRLNLADMVIKPFPIKSAIEAAGGLTSLAKAVGVTPSAIAQWDVVPPLRVLQVERITGVPRWVLRPDIYPPSAEDITAVSA